MSQLSPDQMEHIEKQVNAVSDRFRFEHAAITDRDRKLAIVCVYENDGELHTAVVNTENAPNWLSNNDQFKEVVDAAVKKLKRGF